MALSNTLCTILFCDVQATQTAMLLYLVMFKARVNYVYLMLHLSGTVIVDKAHCSNLSKQSCDSETYKQKHTSILSHGIPPPTGPH